MKKAYKIILSTAFVISLCIFAALSCSAYDNIYEDFDNISGASYTSTQISTVEKPATGGSIRVISDAAGKHLKIQSSCLTVGQSTVDSYIQTKNIALTQGCIFFDAKIPDTIDGSFIVGIRAHNKVNLLSLASFKTGSVSFGGAGTMSLTPDKWYSFCIRIDESANKIEYFVKNNEGKWQLHSTASNLTSYKADRDLSSGGVRFVANVNTASTSASSSASIDNISIITDGICDGTGMVVTDKSLKIKSGSTYTDTDYLSSGDYMAYTKIANMTDSAKSAIMVCALYREDVVVKTYKKSVNIDANSDTTASISFTVNDASSVNSVKIMLLDSFNNLMPLTYADEYESSGYVRPNGEKIISDLIENSPDHPRLMANADDFARIRELRKTDPLLNSWVTSVINSADYYVSRAQTPTYRVDSGGRMVDTKTYMYMHYFGFAYQMTGEQKYVDAAYKHLEIVCKNFPDWHPGHFLDCASMMQGVSIAYDWMYDGFNETQRGVIEKAIYEYGILAGVGAYEGTTEGIEPAHGTFGRSGWTKTDNNWNCVCNSGLTMASIAIGDVYPETVGPLMEKVVVALENGVTCYAPDGGYAESPGYWSYGTSNLVLLLASLDKAMGTDYNLFSASPGLDQTGYFPLYIESMVNGAFNYHDCAEGFVDTGSLLWFAEKLGDPDMARLSVNDIINGRRSVDVYDILWYNPDNLSDEVNLDLDRHFEGIQTVTMRNSWAADDTEIFTALHAGYNNINHGNLDSGTFILDMGGTRWFCDLGSEYYNVPGYFSSGAGGQRWTYYRMRAEGQNTVIINPSATKEDAVVYSHSPITAYESAPSGSFAVTDMTAAHGVDKVKSAKRGLWLANGRECVVLQDEITLNAPGEMYWFAHYKTADTTVTISDDGRSVIMQRGDKRLSGTIVSDNPDAKFTVMAAEPLTGASYASGEYSRTAYKKLAIHLTGVSEVNLAVVFTLLDDAGSTPGFDYIYTDISNWSLTDSVPVPTLSSITLDGALIDGFSSDVRAYDIVLDEDADVPEIKAYSGDSNARIEITAPSELPGTAQIKISDPDNPSFGYIYSVFMRRDKKIQVTASHYQEGNPPENSIDDNYSTRWSADKEAWIMYTFDTPRYIDTVSVAFWKANTRKQNLKIEVSADGASFETVFSGQSSYTTDTLEPFTFTKRLVKAVKITCNGNTSTDGGANTWNSILEAAFE